MAKTTFPVGVNGAVSFSGTQIEGVQVLTAGILTIATALRTNTRVVSAGQYIDNAEPLSGASALITCASGASANVTVSSPGSVQNPPPLITTVARLPTASTGLIGFRAFVTDANAAFTAGIGAVVAGGGANTVPVYCDGAAWRIG